MVETIFSGKFLFPDIVFLIFTPSDMSQGNGGLSSTLVTCHESQETSNDLAIKNYDRDTFSEMNMGKKEGSPFGNMR